MKNCCSECDLLVVCARQAAICAAVGCAPEVPEMLLDTRAWLEASSFNEGVLDASAWLEASVQSGLSKLGPAVGCKRIAGGVLCHTWFI